jgi:CBS domain containing-hemolysin-like protein
VQLIVEKGHSRIPVYQDTIDNVIGVVHAKDILAQWMEKNGHGASISLEDMMRRPLFIPETKNISVLLRELKQNKVHMAIVLDEYGGTAGLVTMEDLVEEIVGEIEDEYDIDESKVPEFHLISEREAELSGRLHIDEINELLNLEIPEDDAYDTLGGFIFSALGRVPERGERWDFDNLEFEIIDADARRINRVKVVVGE